MRRLASQELLCTGSVMLKEFLDTTLGCAQASGKGDTAQNDVRHFRWLQATKFDGSVHWENDTVYIGLGFLCRPQPEHINLYSIKNKEVPLAGQSVPEITLAGHCGTHAGSRRTEENNNVVSMVV